MPPVRFCKSADGTSIAFVVFGESPDLVITTHGTFGMSHEISDDLGGPYHEELGRRYRVTCFDVRGHGDSDREPARFGIDAEVEDLQAVIAAVGLDRFALNGNCIGALGAAAFAARHPEQVTALVLFSLPADDKGGFEQPVLKMIRNARETDPKLAAHMYPPLWAPDAPRSIHDSPKRALDDSMTQTRRRAFLSATDIDEDLLSLSMPVLIMQREGDALREPSAGRRIAARIPGAQLVTLLGSDHFQWLGDFAGVIQITDEFLRQARPSTGSANAPESAGSFRTILFTDGVASTPLLAQLKDEKMRAIMRDHDEVLEAAVTNHGGRVIKTIGDAFMAEFAVPSGAVEAAIAAQRGIRDKFADSDVPIRLRIGINAGEPIEEDGDLHGASVVIAKRLESEAENGGILVSDVVRSAVAGKDFAFEDRGEVSLRGFDEPVRAWSVAW